MATALLGLHCSQKQSAENRANLGVSAVATRQHESYTQIFNNTLWTSCGAFARQKQTQQIRLSNAQNSEVQL